MRKSVLWAFAAVLFSGPVHAQEDELRFDLARVLVGEADDASADWAAILWTLQHRSERSGRPLADVVKYSAILRADTPRARAMRSLGTATPEESVSTLVRARQWARALAFVDAWRAGAVKDPCPRAVHWGGPLDSKPPKRTVVFCGYTRNEFFYCTDRSC